MNEAFFSDTVLTGGVSGERRKVQHEIFSGGKVTALSSIAVQRGKWSKLTDRPRRPMAMSMWKLHHASRRHPTKAEGGRNLELPREGPSRPPPSLSLSLSLSPSAHVTVTD